MSSNHDVFFSFLLGHSLASQQTLLSVIVHGKQFKCLSLTENDGAIKSLVLFNIISLLHSSEFLLNGVCSVIKISYLRTVKVRPVCLIVLFVLKYVFRCPLPQTNSTFFIQSITSVIRNTSSNHLSLTTPPPVRAQRKGLSLTVICRNTIAFFWKCKLWKLWPPWKQWDHGLYFYTYVVRLHLNSHALFLEQTHGFIAVLWMHLKYYQLQSFTANYWPGMFTAAFQVLGFFFFFLQVFIRAEHFWNDVVSMQTFIVKKYFSVFGQTIAVLPPHPHWLLQCKSSETLVHPCHH